MRNMTQNGTEKVSWESRRLIDDFADFWTKHETNLGELRRLGVWMLPEDRIYRIYFESSRGILPKKGAAKLLRESIPPQDGVKSGARVSTKWVLNEKRAITASNGWRMVRRGGNGLKSRREKKKTGNSRWIAIRFDTAVEPSLRQSSRWDSDPNLVLYFHLVEKPKHLKTEIPMNWLLNDKIYIYCPWKTTPKLHPAIAEEQRLLLWSQNELFVREPCDNKLNCTEKFPWAIDQRWNTTNTSMIFLSTKWNKLLPNPTKLVAQKRWICSVCALAASSWEIWSDQKFP